MFTIVTSQLCFILYEAKFKIDKKSSKNILMCDMEHVTPNSAKNFTFLLMKQMNTLKKKMKISI